MAKELLFYTSFNTYSVADIITQLEANKGNDISIRMNTPGGSVYDGYGAIAKFQEHTGAKTIKVDGRADSFGAYFLCAADDVECLDVSRFVFHRAAMPAWYEADANYFTDAMKAELTKVNENLRAMIESRTTAAKWKSVTGTSLDDMFSLTSRIDVSLNAEQAKKLGLVARVNKITPKKLSEIKALSPELAAEYASLIEANTDNENNEAMAEIKTLADLKAAHPALVAEAITEARTTILADEKDRIEAFAAYAEIDPKGVLAAITGGAKFTQKFAAEMHVKAMSKNGLKNMAASSAPEAETTETGEEATAEEKAAADFMKGVLAQAKSTLNIQ